MFQKGYVVLSLNLTSFPNCSPPPPFRRLPPSKKLYQSLIWSLKELYLLYSDASHYKLLHLNLYGNFPPSKSQCENKTGRSVQKQIGQRYLITSGSVGSICFWASLIRVPSQRYRSGSFYHQETIVRKTVIPTVLLLLYFFISLKNNVNVPSKSNKQKSLEKIPMSYATPLKDNG
jgi:hypothetical protein